MIESEEQYEELLKELDENTARIQKIESELATLRMEQASLVRERAEFRKSLPMLEQSLQMEKDRLMGADPLIQENYKKIEEHRKALDEICSKWMAQSEARLELFGKCLPR